MLIKIVDEPDPKPIPKLATEFVNEKLLPNLANTDQNKVICVALGGSHSKNLHNSRSDVDLTVYYTTNAKNLLSFNRKTLNIVPSGFAQKHKPKNEGAVFYEWEGLEFEIATVPSRRVGQGGDLLGALYTNNTKVLHDSLVHYPLFRIAEWDWTQEMILGEDYDWSSDAAVGYFNGYMHSQLLNHKRRVDWADRELKALQSNSLDPIVKAIVSGVYIGQSGLLLLDKLEVSRDARQLWNRYKQHFDNNEREFMESVFDHKTDKKRIIERVDVFAGRAGRMRESIFHKMKVLFEESHAKALSEQRFPVNVDNLKKNKAIDKLQLKLLGME